MPERACRAAAPGLGARAARRAKRPTRSRSSSASTGTSAGRTEPLDVQIYATDLDRDGDRPRAQGGLPARHRGRRLAGAARSLLREEDAGYRVKKDIRDMVVFATAEPHLRSAVHEARHPCLPQRAHLSRAGAAAEAPAAVPLRARAGRRAGPRHGGGGARLRGRIHADPQRAARSSGVARVDPRPRPGRIEFPLGRPSSAAAPARTPAPWRSHAACFPEVVQRSVVEHVAPPVVVVDKDGDLLFASQRTGRYFEPAGREGDRQRLRDGARGPRASAPRGGSKALARRRPR